MALCEKSLQTADIDKCSLLHTGNSIQSRKWNWDSIREERDREAIIHSCRNPSIGNKLMHKKSQQSIRNDDKLYSKLKQRDGCEHIQGTISYLQSRILH